jgi:hypothetical protein
MSTSRNVVPIDSHLGERGASASRRAFHPASDRCHPRAHIHVPQVTAFSP